jgi:hypothetical protein
MAGWDVLDDIEYEGQSLAELDRDLVEFKDCEVKHVTEKAIIVAFPIGVTRPVPKSQLVNGSIRLNGERGTLMVTRWLGRKLQADFTDPQAAADDEVEEFDDVICMSETAASVLVQLSCGTEYRLPKSQLKGGDIQHDGDAGTLRVAGWIAKQKGMV